jgi:geranylgeranyl diphosphate synthase type I
MRTTLRRLKPHVDATLVSFLNKKKPLLSRINPWGGVAIDILKTFCCGGKTIRGSLLIFSYRMFHNGTRNTVLKAAAALELLHSSLLIHDDIMDRDPIRRGKPSVHMQFKKIARSRHIRDEAHFARSLAECVGDLGIFAAFECLSEIPVSSFVHARLMTLFSKEMTYVISAQMQDVAWGLGEETATVQNIESLNRFKTARYTFSLPLVTGALLAKQNESTIVQLEKLGESLGLAYQLRDDYLGLFGTSKTLGKPIGSDIREGKKNLLRLYLESSERQTDAKMLSSIWNKKSLTSSAGKRLSKLADDYGLKETLYAKIKKYQRTSYPIIDRLPINGEDKEKLRELVRIVSVRSA